MRVRHDCVRIKRLIYPSTYRRNNKITVENPLHLSNIIHTTTVDDFHLISTTVQVRDLGMFRPVGQIIEKYSRRKSHLLVSTLLLTNQCPTNETFSTVFLVVRKCSSTNRIHRRRVVRCIEQK